MNPVLMEIYSTVLSGAPYVIAAYAGILLVLFAYVCFVMVSLHRTEKKIIALEEHVVHNALHSCSSDDAVGDILKEK